MTRYRGMFALVSIVFFAFMAFIWSSKDFLNIFIKMLFTVMMFWASFEALKAFGWIVKG